MSTREKRNASSRRLTTTFAAVIRKRRLLGLAVVSAGIRKGTEPYITTDSCENQLSHAHSDDRARAVFRAARYTFQRVSPHPRAHRARSSGRSRDLSVRRGRLDA